MFLKILGHPVFANLNFHMPLIVDLSHPLIMLKGENGCGKSTLLHAIYYALRGDFARAFVRLRRGAVPVSMNGRTVWTTYYTPREFHREFAQRFELTVYRGLALCLPPPYLVDLYLRFPALGRLLRQLDDHLAGLPLLRDAGDHFLMVMTRRAGPR